MKNSVENAQTTCQSWGLELPIYVMGQINVGSGKIFIGVGPFVALGLDAIRKPGNIDLYKKNQSDNKSIMHRWDFGLGAMVGYEFSSGIALHCAYQAGLINTLSAEKDLKTMRTKIVLFGVGYKF